MKKIFFAGLVICLVLGMTGCGGGVPQVEQFTITLLADPAGGGTVSGGGTYDKNAVVTVIATANEGYTFVNWTEGEDVASADATYSFPAAKDRELTAHFDELPPDKYALALQANPAEGGMVTDNTGAGPYAAGTTVTVTATANAGYTFVNWTVDGSEVSPDATFDFTMPAGNTTLTANFEPEMYTYNLTLQADPPEAGRVIDNTNAGPYEWETTVNVTAEANEGYIFAQWMEGYIMRSNNATFDYSMPPYDTTLAAVFVDDFTGYFPEMREVPGGLTCCTGIDNTGRATVENAFLIAETEVTYELWYPVRIWAEANGYTLDVGREGSDGTAGGRPAYKNEPVTAVSWYSCIAWLNALSEYLGYTPVYWSGGDVYRDAGNRTAGDAVTQEDTDGFRLPTNDEWEMAARYRGNDYSCGAIECPAGSGYYWTPGDYAGGATGPWDNYDDDATNEAAWYAVNSGVSRKTQEVGQKPPSGNGLGLYDMSGNVWEMCFDQDPEITWEVRRIIRGGSFEDFANKIMLGVSMESIVPQGSGVGVGFRIVRNAETE